MDTNYQLQLWLDKETKILENQTDTQCKLVLLGMYKNFNQQQWPNRHLRAKI